MKTSKVQSPINIEIVNEIPERKAYALRDSFPRFISGELKTELQKHYSTFIQDQFNNNPALRKLNLEQETARGSSPFLNSVLYQLFKPNIIRPAFSSDDQDGSI